MAERLYEELGLNKREAKELVELFFEEIRHALEDNEQVKLSGFGNFDLRDKRQRPGRNPKTGEEIPITARRKRYFTIGEVSELCAVKPHVLRYWEQEFPQLNPVKRTGNRRYYQRQDVLMIRQIRALLYDQGFTISGARQRMSGDEAKDDTTQYKQMIRQMISELEDVLVVLKK
eukprot:gene8661-13393_t